MVGPLAVDELDVEPHEEVSHSDEDVPEVSLLGSNTSLDTYACGVKIHADRYHGEMSFQLERQDGFRRSFSAGAHRGDNARQ